MTLWPVVLPFDRAMEGVRVHGCLAHKKQPLPLGPPYDPRYSPTVGFQEGCVSYARGTPLLWWVGGRALRTLSRSGRGGSVEAPISYP